MSGPLKTREAIEAQVRELQEKRRPPPPEDQEQNGDAAAAFGGAGHFDQDIYGAGGDSEYLASIPANDEQQEDEEDILSASTKQHRQYSAPKSFVAEAAATEKDTDVFAETRKGRPIAEREDEYQSRKRKLQISPDRIDPFMDGEKTPDIGSRTFGRIMTEKALAENRTALNKEMAERAKSGTLKPVETSNADAAAKKRRRWDVETPERGALGGGATSNADAPTPGGPTPSSAPKMKLGGWEANEAATPSVRHWDETPQHFSATSETPNISASARWGDSTLGGGATPAAASATPRRNRWDETPRDTPAHMTPCAGAMTPGWAETPRTDRGTLPEDIKEETPGASKRRSRWDLTPAQTPSGAAAAAIGATPGKFTPSGGTPMGFTPAGGGGMMTPSGVTPVGSQAMALQTPHPSQLMGAMTPEQMQAFRYEKEIDDRNRPLTDEELEALFPPGYKILPPPAGYMPIRTPGRKLTATPTPMTAGFGGGFMMQGTPERGGGAGDKNMILDTQPKDKDLPPLKPEDMQY